MKFFTIFIILLILFLFEVTLIQIPLLLLYLLVLAVVYRSEWIFVIGFLSGLFLDGLTMRTLGSSSLFFLIFLFLIFLYERKFELRSVGFVIMMSGLGSLFFLLIFGHELLFIQVLVSIIFGVILFLIFSFLNPETEKKQLDIWKK